MFFFWAGCTVISFVTAVFFLPETKGKTLEEIEDYLKRPNLAPICKREAPDEERKPDALWSSRHYRTFFNPRPYRT